MKKIFTYIFAVSAVLMLVSCSKDAKVSTYDPAAEKDGVYSFIAESMSATLSAASPTFGVDVLRGDTKSASQLNVSVSQYRIVNGTAVPVTVLKVPTSVSFDEGEGIAVLEVGYNSSMEVGVKYYLDIAIDEADASAGGVSQIEYEVNLDYSWKSIGKGEFFDNLVLMSEDSYGIADVEVMQAEGFSRYRIMEPYADKAQLTASWGSKYLGGKACPYIEFWVEEQDGISYVKWDKFWYTTLLYAGDGTDIKAYLPSCLASSVASRDKNSRFVEEKVVQFNPYYYIDALKGGWSSYFAYFTLPGGPDLEKWLTE